ncbi:MAG TPA: VOC family protein, partial [Spirochaetota bacterium]
MKILKIMNRFYVHDMDQAISFYEKLMNEKCSRRFTYQKVNLELASVGNILLICGTDEAVKPFVTTNS